MDEIAAETTRSEDLFATAAIELASFELAFDRPGAAMVWIERAGPFVADRWQARWLAERCEAAVACGNEAVAVASLLRVEAIASVTGDRWASAAVLRLRAITADSRSARVRWSSLAAEAFLGVNALTDAGRSLAVQASAGDGVQQQMLLGRAAGLFRTSGALAWEQRVRADMHPIPDPFDDLTDAERRIATFVSDGARNKEIAELLNVSLRTVESHLERVYRKLGIRSRTELARLSLAG